MKMFLGLLVLASMVVLPCEGNNATGSYLLTMPSQMEVGKQQRICLTLYKYRRMDVYYTLRCPEKKKRYFYERNKYRRGQGGCITFTIPKNLGGLRHKLSLAMIGPRRFREHSSHTFTPLAPQLTTFIHTDKPIYKPGQLVRIRIMTVDSELMPVTDKISLVRIITPSGVIMKQWRDLDNKKGMLTLEFQLAAEPMLGDWAIMAETGGKETQVKFEIAEYVLPKFSITLTPPSRVNEKTELIEGEVCSKYTYGQPVKGKIMVDTCITELFQTYGTGKKPCAVIHGEINGCFTYSFAASILRPYFENRYNALKLSTFVAILEEATGLLVNQTVDGPVIKRFAVKVDIKTYTRKFFKPLLPYEFRALVTGDDGKPVSHLMMTLSCKQAGFSGKIMTDNKGFASYFFPRLGTEKPLVIFELLADDTESRHPSTYYVAQWFSPSDSYLEIQPISKPLSPGLGPIAIYRTNPPTTPFRVVAQIMSRGRIVHHSHNRYKVRKNPDGSYRASPPWCAKRKHCAASKKFSPDVPSFNVYVNVTCSMAPEATLLVYYLTNNGEVVADAETFKVDPCFSNPVKMAFTPSKEYPGYPTQLSLTAAPGSLCMVGVVDQSVYVLGGKNQITPKQLFSALERYNADPSKQFISEDAKTQYCEEYLKRTGLSNSDEIAPPHYSYYTARSTYKYISDYVDSNMAFLLSSLSTAGPLKLDSRPCRKEHTFRYFRGRRSVESDNDEWQADGGGLAGSGDDDSDQEDDTPDPKKKTVALRQYFPETWLWDLEIVGDSGKLELNKTLPGSITEWVGSTVCAKSDVGVGVSESASVTAFQPFFVSFTLPYAAIRGEYIPLTVTVFNYLTECIEIELRLNESSEFDLLNPERVTWMCICGNEAKRHDYVIVPQNIGFINITAQAKSIPGDSQCPKVTAAGEAIGIKDAVVRQLLVEPEGDEKEYTYSTMACSETGTEFFDSIDLPLPADQAIVPDSGRGVLSVIGDLMGPSFSNIGDLLRVPYGCGEQNMINFAPNVFIMSYLKSTNQLTPEISETINKYLGSGYQRELNYMRDDGSFSAFGNSDRSGSTWLTAFVIKSFTEAQPFLEIDENVLRRARLWLKRKQSTNGCFAEVGRVIHSSMRGGVDGANSDVTLTAYVIGALIIAGTPKEDRAIQNAIKCIAAQPITDVYTMASAAYATSLQDANSQVHVNVQRGLHSNAIINGTLMHWETKKDANRQRSYYYRASSLNVETTAYALLAYLEEDDLESSLKVVKWLQKQRNPKGGFASTQDTVVALDALSKFAKLAAIGEKLKMSLTVEGKDVHKNFIVSGSNSMVMQTEPLKVPNEITLNGVGTGCAMFQATVRYNTYDLDKVDLAFTLNATVQPPDPVKPDCGRRTINICTAFVKNESSGMAIVNAKMVTGWLIDGDSLERLKNDTDLKLKRYEVDSKRPDSVHFYFEELNPAPRCLTLDVIQEIKVENTKDALIQVYDYYDTELVTKVFYNIKNDCTPKTPRRPPPDKMATSSVTSSTAAPDFSQTGLGMGTDIDGSDGGMTDIDEGEKEDGSGVLDNVDPVYLADGLVPQPDSIPVMNLYSKIAEEIDLDKETPDGKKKKKDSSAMEVKVRVGSTAILICPLASTYSNTPEKHYKLTWVDEETNTVIAHDGVRLVDEERYSVVETSNLRIDNARLEDSGKYLCSVNTVPVETAAISLTIQESPVIVVSSNDTFAAMGEEATLFCNVTGSPEPKITWYRSVGQKEKKRVGKGHELVIKSAQASATYQCMASNGVPPDVSTRIQLSVSVAPFILPKTLSRVGGHLNKSVLLECVVKASPPLTQSWTKGGRVLLSDDKYSFKTISLDSNTYSTELRINDLVRRDYDDYTCEISNEHGIVSRVVTLYDNTPTTPAPTTTTSQPSTPFTGGCPICEPMSEKQATFAYCQAAAAYKVLGIRIRRSRVKVKILVDFRPVKRVKIRRVLRLVIDKKCSCDVIKTLKPRGMVALFMMRKRDFTSKPREIVIGSETSAILLSKKMERKIILGRSSCKK
ncbi:alpha-2-macroglobulin-like [Haliotis cracherodii]|uniref:alpha-2-macroglobulin-like n=1 Tax=Haliotis cracherodii TaxID=6455 RepID=UPI0039E895B7